MCTCQRVRNIRFSENLRCSVFLKHPFWDLPFCLITDSVYRFLCQSVHVSLWQVHCTYNTWFHFGCCTSHKILIAFVSVIFQFGFLWVLVSFFLFIAPCIMVRGYRYIANIKNCYLQGSCFCPLPISSFCRVMIPLT